MCAGGRSDLRIYNSTTFELARTITIPESAISAEFIDDELMLVSVSRGGIVLIVSYASGEVVRSMPTKSQTGKKTVLVRKKCKFSSMNCGIY